MLMNFENVEEAYDGLVTSFERAIQCHENVMEQHKVNGTTPKSSGSMMMNEHAEFKKTYRDVTMFLNQMVITNKLFYWLICHYRKMFPGDTYEENTFWTSEPILFRFNPSIDCGLFESIGVNDPDEEKKTLLYWINTYVDIYTSIVDWGESIPRSDLHIGLYQGVNYTASRTLSPSRFRPNSFSSISWFILHYYAVIDQYWKLKTAFDKYTFHRVFASVKEACIMSLTTKFHLLKEDDDAVLEPTMVETVATLGSNPLRRALEFVVSDM